MIKISNLNKNFGDLKVLRDISIEIKKGDIYGFIGVSGVGKSTLLRCINGLETYDTGSLKVDEVEVKELKKNELRKYQSQIGMIFQQFMLMERMNVYENITFPMKCWGLSKDERDRKVDELFKLVELEDKKYSLPKELSGGQKQRVAIARALSMNPKILLCDEATSALDPNITKSILELLGKINEELGITIVIVTHQMSVVKQICNKMSIITNGELSCEGDVEEIFLEFPSELEELLSEDLDSKIPNSGINLEIIHRDGDSNSILSKMAIETGIPYDIVWGKVDKYRNGVYGSVTINIKDEDFYKIKQFLDKVEIEWRLL